MSARIRTLVLALGIGVLCIQLHAAETVEHPFLGVSHISRSESSPRTLRMHIVQIDLTVPGLDFKMTPPGGTLETVRQTTLAFLSQEHAQIAVNSHFFLPFPSADPNAMLIGLAASRGNVYSGFENPVQSYAIVSNAPAVNIEPSNTATIVHRDFSAADAKHVAEPVALWNALAGSAQIVTNGVKTIPVYVDAQHPDGLLAPGGPAAYSNANSWYDLLNARTAIGVSEDGRTLTLFTVDRAGGSLGMSVGEVADLLMRDYGVFNALSLDGGGSTTLALQNPITLAGAIVNVSSDNPAGRSVGSNLAVFATADTIAPHTTATTFPAANAFGWHNAPVSVTIAAVDNHGGWVKDVHYALGGAQTGGPAVVPGSTAQVAVTSDGNTTVTYFATDFAGNQESGNRLTVLIDGTAPIVAGMPTDGCSLWPPNHRMRHVATIRASDTLSGVLAGSLHVGVSNSEATADNDPDVQLTPLADGSLAVDLRAERLGDGPGRTYVISAAATDFAGNVTTVSATCYVPHDRGMH